MPAGSPSVMARGFTPRSIGGRGDEVLTPSTPSTLLVLLLEQVLDAVLLNEHVRRAFAIHFQAVSVVPLDHAADHLAVGRHHDHRRAGAHLFEVVERLGTGGFGRQRALLRAVEVSVPRGAPAEVFHGPEHSRAAEVAVHLRSIHERHSASVFALLLVMTRWCGTALRVSCL